MERIWAPWRGEYVTDQDKPEGCLFCHKAALKDDLAQHILKRGQYSFVLLNRYPYNCGHLMVAPYRHTAELEKLKEDEIRELLLLTQQSIEVLKSTTNPQGFNVGFNLGESAGAGVVDHLHLHIVPRWTGDTNFMPVLNQTRVMPQSLEEVYSALRKEFNQRVDS